MREWVGGCRGVEYWVVGQFEATVAALAGERGRGRGLSTTLRMTGGELETGPLPSTAFVRRPGSGFR